MNHLHKPIIGPRSALILVLVLAVFLATATLLFSRIQTTASSLDAAPGTPSSDKLKSKSSENVAWSAEQSNRHEVVNARLAIRAAYFFGKRDRAFVIDAWQRPAEGGKLYASHIVDRCSFSRAGSDLLKLAQPSLDIVGPDNYLAAMKALQSIQGRCGQFSESDFVSYSSRSLVAAGDSGEDMLMAEIKGFNASLHNGDMKARRAALEALMNTADPLAFQDIGLSLALYKDGSNSYLYFDGTRYPINSNPALATAIYLLPCSLGLPCDEDDPDLQIGCVSGSGCFESRLDKVNKQLPADKAAEVVRLSASLAAAIRSKEVDKFLPAS